MTVDEYFKGHNKDLNSADMPHPSVLPKKALFYSLEILRLLDDYDHLFKSDTVMAIKFPSFSKTMIRRTSRLKSALRLGVSIFNELAKAQASYYNNDNLSDTSFEEFVMMDNSSNGSFYGDMLPFVAKFAYRGAQLSSTMDYMRWYVSNSLVTSDCATDNLAELARVSEFVTECLLGLDKTLESYRDEVRKLSEDMYEEELNVLTESVATQLRDCWLSEEGGGE